MRIVRHPLLHVASAVLVVAAAAFITTRTSHAQMGQSHTSSRFAGAKANMGTVTHTRQGNKNLLTLSDDFKVPDTPDPHWQLVDSEGTVYLLDKLSLKGDRVAKTITVPGYVPDVAKVVIWCAWAEANLGEATFSAPLKLK
jgi:hypothetical protein